MYFAYFCYISRIFFNINVLNIFIISVILVKKIQRQKKITNIHCIFKYWHRPILKTRMRNPKALELHSIIGSILPTKSMRRRRVISIDLETYISNISELAYCNQMFLITRTEKPIKQSYSWRRRLNGGVYRCVFITYSVGNI